MVCTVGYNERGRHRRRKGFFEQFVNCFILLVYQFWIRNIKYRLMKVYMNRKADKKEINFVNYCNKEEKLLL